jgi:drug/metabolite transporter (DMT)-like permease
MTATATAYRAGGDTAAAARRRDGLGLALVTACISGVAVFVNGYGVRRFPDATLYTTAKNLVTAFVLLGLAAVAQARRRRASVDGRVDRRGDRPTRRAWAGLILVATIGGSVPFVLFFEGLSRASSTDAAVIHKTLVVWVALFAIPLLGERISAVHVGAIALLVAGQAALAGGLPVLASDAGEAMILAATLLWAAETILAK